MSLGYVVDGMAAALAPVAAEIPGLEVYPGWNNNPTPPALDMYPAPVFQEGAGFGVRSKKTQWIVRARVSAVDMDSANRLLLRMLDPADTASVEAALAAIDVTVGSDGEVSGYTAYTDDTAGDLLGCQWRVTRYL